MQDHNAAFSLFGQPVYWYGIIIGAGALLAALLARARESKLGLAKDTTLDLALIVLPLGLICARLYYVAFSWDQFRGDPAAILNIRLGGMAIYGGILGGILGGYIYAKWKKIPFLRLADLVAPGLVLAQGIGRWGNFMNQEAFGFAVTNPALQWFPVSVFIQADQTWHLAAFFYESAWCVLVAGALLIIESRGSIRRVGDVFLLYVLLYMAERTLVEGLRTDSLYLMGVRVSQWLSIVGMSAVSALFAGRLMRLSTRPAARLHMALALLLAVAQVACAALDFAALRFLTLFTALALIHALFIYARLPSAHPYD